MKNFKHVNTSKKLGFTLVEVLTVVAIIGILASVALAYVQDARQQARSAKVIEIARQFLPIAELMYQDTGSYEDLHRAYIADCDEFDAGNYITELRRLCQIIIDNDGAFFSGALAEDTTPGCCGYVQDNTKYSIIVNLPSAKNEYFCVSSNGNSFRGKIGNDPDISDDENYNDNVYDEDYHPKGCPFNP